jgi:hypothetical protein
MSARFKNLEVIRDGNTFGLRYQADEEIAGIFAFTSAKARRLIDLYHHLQDLEVANDCIAAIPHVARGVVMDSLWTSAIVHYTKCFGSPKGAAQGRSQLNEKSLFGSDNRLLEGHRYYLTYRNKHLVHDEKTLMQSRVCAVVGRRDEIPRVREVVVFTFEGFILGEESKALLFDLIATASAWARSKSEGLKDSFRQELSEMPHSELLRLVALSCRQVHRHPSSP